MVEDVPLVRVLVRHRRDAEPSGEVPDPKDPDLVVRGRAALGADARGEAGCETLLTMEPITLLPIGFVRSPEKEDRAGSFEDVEAEIELREDLAEGLEGLAEFSHVEVLYLMHMRPVRGAGEMPKLRTRPRGEPSLPEVGLFATRSPSRPNPLGLTLCELLAVEGPVLRVRGLDALDGSPVLDLKPPSLREHEKLPEMRFPDWMKKLRDLPWRR